MIMSLIDSHFMRVVMCKLLSWKEWNELLKHSTNVCQICKFCGNNMQLKETGWGVSYQHCSNCAVIFTGDEWYKLTMEEPNL